MFKFVRQQAERLAVEIGLALQRELDIEGGLAQLEDAIAKMSGGFIILERRKLKNLIQRARGDLNLGISPLELAALDVFLKSKGGLFPRLRACTLADSVSKADALVAFLPSLPAPQDEPERLGFIPVGDVRAAAALREVVLGLNPRLRFQIEEVPKRQGDFEQAFGEYPSGFDGYLAKCLGSRRQQVAIVSIGSPRTNRLSGVLLREFFGARQPFSFSPESRDSSIASPVSPPQRSILVDNQQLSHHAVICFRRTSKEGRLEIVIAGDRSLSTIGAAREISSIDDQVAPGHEVEWALVKTKVDKGRTRVLSSTIVAGYPKTLHPLVEG